MKFIIYAMPRSGSAWLANFLTWDDMVCAHEPLGKISIAELNQLECAIDTGAYMFREEIQAAREFILTRNVRDINESLKEVGLPYFTAYNHPVFSKYHNIEAEITYENLFDIEYLKRLWNLLRNSPFNQKRAEMLIDMNIQHNLHRVIRVESPTWNPFSPTSR